MARTSAAIPLTGRSPARCTIWTAALCVGVVAALSACPHVAAANIHISESHETAAGGRWAIYLDAQDAAELRMYAARVKQDGANKYLLMFESLGAGFKLDTTMGQPAVICKYSREPGQQEDDVNVVVCDSTNVWKIQIEGSEDGDELCVINPANLELNTFIDAHGHEGDDAISGGLAGDELNGEDGHDTVIGNKGDDQLSGFQFAADDQIFPEEEKIPPPTSARDDDLLYGMEGADSIWGGPGEDTIVGGPDRDAMLCGTDGFWDKTKGAPATGCADRWIRDRGGNRIYSSELLDRNPFDGRPMTSDLARDRVNCGGSASATANLVQYDAGLDSVTYCPTIRDFSVVPPQLADPHPVPGPAVQIGDARCPKPN